MRKFMTVLVGFCLALAINGFTVIIVGENIARYFLPPELSTPEVLERHFDGTVCMDCFFSGAVMIGISCLCLFIILPVWATVEVIGVLFPDKQ